MDKKNYLRQPSNKVTTSEPRKSENTLNKPWSRNSKRRENPNNSFKHDQRNNKQNPVKFRSNVDKRPKPRNCFSYFTNDNENSTTPIDLSTTSTGLAKESNAAIQDGDSNDQNDEFNDNFVELNSIYTPGSKKQNLNHLLNFHYTPYENGNGINVFGRNNYNNRNYVKKQKYNKEQFLQANFQFVIKSTAESFIDVLCPDTLIEWSLIEQINIQTTEEPQCPICLYPPIAAKLTRCGHVYCWPCILHYLALSDKTWRKCPICYEAIHLNDLKSTSIIQQTNYKNNDLITFQLMRRKKNSMFPEKYDDEMEQTFFRDKIPHLSNDIDQKRFSKFLLADTHEILSILEKERLELIGEQDPDCPESMFVQQALDLLKDRKYVIENEMKLNVNELEDLVEKSLMIEEKIEIVSLDESSTESENATVQQMHSSFDDVQSLYETVQVAKEAGAISKEKFYYFYQSVDGQNIFLHPLNIKMLQAQYGTLDKGPQMITSKILQKECQSMDGEIRKKFTCLGHLPLTCQFEIVEIEFQPPTVSDRVLKMFKDDIILRQKARTRRARDDKRREKQIDEINERQMGKVFARSANIDIKSVQQFPTCGFEETLNGTSYEDAAARAYAVELADSPPTVIQSPSNYTKSNSFTSFANILSSPKKELWPNLGNSSSNIPFESAWGKSTTALQPQHIGNKKSVSESDSSTDGILHVTQNNFSDVLAEAFEKKKKQAVTTDCSANQNGNKKGKKTKKTFLFSTGMNFNGN